MQAITPGSEEQGFSLVELMVAMLLGLILTAFLVPVLLANVQTFDINNGISRTQENARFVLGELSKNLRMAGFKGCDSKGLRTANLTGNDVFDLESTLIGYERSGTEAITGIEGSSVRLKDATDAIMVKNMIDTQAILTTTILPGEREIGVTRTDSIKEGDVLFLGDCQSGVITLVTAVRSNNITLSAPVTSPKGYNQGTPVYKVEATTYFLAASHNYTNNREAVPTSLWRKVNNGAAEELVAGVEDFQILYGIDSNGDGIANQFQTADSVGGNMQDVAIVRFQIITSSLDEVSSNGPINRPSSISVSLRNRFTI